MRVRPTGLVIRERREVGPIEQVYYRRGSAASRLSPADLNVAYLGSARFLHLTGITPALSQSCRETVFAAADMARAAGVKVVLDPNYRSKLWGPPEARDVLRKLASHCDILLPGMDEAQLLTGLSDPEMAARGTPQPRATAGRGQAWRTRGSGSIGRPGHACARGSRGAYRRSGSRGDAFAVRFSRWSAARVHASGSTGARKSLRRAGHDQPRRHGGSAALGGICRRSLIRRHSPLKIRRRYAAAADSSISVPICQPDSVTQRSNSGTAAAG